MYQRDISHAVKKMYEAIRNAITKLIFLNFTNTEHIVNV